MADFDRDLVLTLRANNADLESKLQSAIERIAALEASLTSLQTKFGAVGTTASTAAAGTETLAGATDTLAGATSAAVGALERESTAIAGGATAAAAAVSAKAALATAAEAAAAAEEDLAGATQLAVTLTNEQGESMQATLVSKEELAAAAEGAAVAEESLAEAAATATVATNAAGVAARGAALDEIRLAEAEDLVAVAEEARAKAITEASASADLALANSRVAFGEWAGQADASSKKAAASFLVARDAVASLEIEIEKARLLGAPIPAGAEAALAQYDVQLAAAATETGVLNVALASTGPAGKTAADGITGILKPAQEGSFVAGIARTNVLGLARALQSLGSTEGLIALVGIIALNKVLGEMEDRGHKVKTVTEAWTDAMDSLSIATGGTSQAVKDMADAFEKAQEGLEGLDVTTRNYTDAEALLSAAGLNAEETFKGIASAGISTDAALKDLERGFGEIGDPINAAKDAADQFVEKLNLIRLTEPGLAKELTGQFIELAKNNELATAKGGEFLTMLTRLASGAEVTAKSFASFGKDAEEARKSFEGLEAKALSLEARFKELKDAGFTDAQAFTVLKGEIEKVATGSERFAGIIATLPPALRATFEHLTDLAGRFGQVDSAIEKNRAKIQEAVNSFSAINAAVEIGTQRYGSHALAIQAVLPAVEKLIADIEKRRDSEGNLQVADQTMLDSLEKIRAGTGQLTTETEKLLDEQAKQAKQVDGIVDSFNKLFKEYDKGAAAIEKHRKATVESARDEADAVRKSTTQQMADLSAALNSSEISQQEFTAEFTRLQGEQVDARRKAEADEAAINAKARADVIELQKTTREKYAEIDEKLRAHNLTLTGALDIQSKYNTSLTAAKTASAEEAIALEKVRGILGGELGIAAVMGATQVNTQAAAISVGALSAQLVTLNGHTEKAVGLLNALGAAAANAFSGVEGGGHTSVGENQGF